MEKRDLAAMTLAAAMLSAAPVRGGGFQALAADLSRAARNAGVERVAVAPFVSADGAKSREGWGIAQKLTTQLVRSGEVTVVERDRLPDLMDERRLAETGAVEAAEALRGGTLRAGAAVVTGSFEVGRRGYVINARVIDVRTGVVLGAAEEAAERDEAAYSAAAAPAPGVWVSVPELTVAAPEFPEGDLMKDSCAGAAERIDAMEARILEPKARYWALRLRQGLDLSRLTANPGSTISDPDLKRRFYERMKHWYEAKRVASLTAEETSLMVELDSAAYALHRECGL